MLTTPPPPHPDANRQWDLAVTLELSFGPLTAAEIHAALPRSLCLCKGRGMAGGGCRDLEAALERLRARGKVRPVPLRAGKWELV